MNIPFWFSLRWMFSCMCAAGSQDAVFNGSSSTGRNTDWLKKDNEELKNICCFCTFTVFVPGPLCRAYRPSLHTAHSSHQPRPRPRTRTRPRPRPRTRPRAKATHTEGQAPSRDTVCYCTKDTLCPDRIQILVRDLSVRHAPDVIVVRILCLGRTVMVWDVWLLKCVFPEETQAGWILSTRPWNS